MYLVDTNIIFNAFNYYPRSVFPSYWNALEDFIVHGKLLFHERTKQEIEKRSDDKSDWFAKVVPSTSIVTINETEIANYAELTKWARFQRRPAYTTVAVQEFLNVADSWLVASARARSLIIVTNETSKPNGVNRIKIPDAASALGINSITGIELFQREGIQF